jgi:ATP-dependent Lon protease
MDNDRVAKVDSAHGGGSAAPAAPAAPEAVARHESAARPLPDDALIILPVRNVVMFPGVVAPLTVGRECSLAAA